MQPVGFRNIEIFLYRPWNRQLIALHYKGMEFEIGVEQFRRFDIEIFNAKPSLICLLFAHTNAQINSTNIIDV